MRNILTILLIFLGYTNLYAFKYNTIEADVSNFIELKNGYTMVEKTKVLHSEPLSNIVGGDSKSITLMVGLSGELDNMRPNSTKNMKHIKVYAYLSRYDKVKYNELIFGVGARAATDTYYNIYKVDFDFSAGLGSQSNKGKNFHLDTNVNTANYATNKIKKGSYTGKYTQDTNVFEVNIGIGISFKTSIDNLLIRPAYQYHYKNYEFQYKIEGEKQYMNLGGIVQDNHEFSISMTYIF